MRSKTALLPLHWLANTAPRLTPATLWLTHTHVPLASLAGELSPAAWPSRWLELAPRCQWNWNLGDGAADAGHLRTLVRAQVVAGAVVHAEHDEAVAAVVEAIVLGVVGEGEGARRV